MRRKMKKLKAALKSEKSDTERNVRLYQSSFSSDSSSNSDIGNKEDEIPIISKKYYKEDKVEIGNLLDYLQYV